VTATLAGADPDGDPLTYAACAIPIDSQAYDLKQQYGLTYTGSYRLNAAGAHEKWLKGTGGQWFIILPDGEVRKWLGNLVLTLAVPATERPDRHQPCLLRHPAPALESHPACGAAGDVERFRESAHDQSGRLCRHVQR